MTLRVSSRIAAAATVALAGGIAAAPAAAQKIDGSYICVFNKAQVTKEKVNERAQAAANGNGQLQHVYRNSIHGFAIAAPVQAIARIRANNPNIAYCEQDQVMRILQAKGGTTSQPAQSVPWGINRVGWRNYTGTGRAFVIDSGVDLDHPDLNVDTGLSRSFTSENTADDGNGHGTHVAGTIAARNNTIGVIGVAAGARVVAVKVLTRSGSGSTSGVIAGVDYVASIANANDVANMSLGGGVSQALDNAVVSAAAKSGAAFTLAAGNESDDANNHSPARANGTNVYTVSAFGRGNAWASFSNYGNPPIDWAEPGASILSTYKGGGYATLSGTSMAAPHLAGILLAGNVAADGTVVGDPDGRADSIGKLR
jgi:hypothetical protein